MSLCNTMLSSFLNGLAATMGVLVVLAAAGAVAARLTGKRLLPRRRPVPPRVP
jgi:hypothetical protein